MNRNTLFTPALAVMFLAAGLLQGCGQSAESKHAGTYELDKAVIMEDMEATIAAIEDPEEREGMEMGMAMMGAGMLDMMQMSITLNADGTASSTSLMMGETETVTGTWSARGDQVRIEMVQDGQTEAVSGKITGDLLELIPPEDEDIPFRMVLKKKGR
jgi:hypothetical protein